MRGITAIFTSLSCGIALAQSRGTAADALALLEKATNHYQAVGRDDAFADFAVKGGVYYNNDLYVFCIRDGLSPVLSFHPIVSSKVNRPVETWVDPEGRPIGLILLREALRDGKGQMRYPWPNPLTKKIEQKVTLAAKVADDEVCAVGYYE